MADMSDEYKPLMSDERAAQLRAWRDAGFESAEHRQDVSMEYLGLKLEVPRQVHAPTPMSDLFGRALLEEVQSTDRVLDMGTGSGVNAILAASEATDVVAVDINPFAVNCAKQNAQRNGVAGRVRIFESDVFSDVDGKFDLIIFDPPFRWFAPRDIREVATADENYRALRTFFRQVRQYLNPEGRILLFFETSGDSDYLHQLIEKTRLEAERLGERHLTKDGLEIEYFTYRLRKTVE